MLVMNPSYGLSILILGWTWFNFLIDSSPLLANEYYYNIDSESTHKSILSNLVNWLVFTMQGPTTSSANLFINVYMCMCSHLSYFYNSKSVNNKFRPPLINS